MIKRGIWTINQLKTGKLKGIWGDDKFVAADLYIEILNNSEYKDLQELVLMSMQDQRGAYKRTYEKRFEAFDIAVEAILKPGLSDWQETNILDVGISDGRTAVDFYARLKPYLSKNHSYHATDYSPYIKVITKGKTRIILDGWDNLIQIIRPPFVLNTSISKNILLYPINYAALILLKTFIAKPVIKAYKANEVEAVELSLFNIDLQNLAQDNKNIHLAQYNVLEAVPFDKKFKIVRAMNLFNESYFTDAEFQTAFNNLKDKIEEGGYFIIGSNQDAGSVVNGHVFQKTENGYKEVYKSGDGAPITNLQKYLSGSVMVQV
ncbi:MAG: hypothetical protein COA45_03840 [Zetaproteobacteria bacterium]|nr:MAG: hypothetical protein COA45_03840 [Zetaproteobacteria bacterium]